MINYVDISESTAVTAHFLGLLEEFARLGFEVHAIVPKPRRGVPQNLKITKSAAFIWTINPPPRSIMSTTRFLLQLPAIVRECLRFLPTLIYIRYAPLTAMQLCTLKMLRKLPRLRATKVVLEVNGWDPDERSLAGANPFKVGILRRLHIYSARAADAVRVVTLGLKGLLAQEGVDPAKIFVVGNGTDVERFAPMDKAEARAMLGLDPHLAYVGFIGNLAKWQGVGTLLYSAKLMLDTVRAVRFLIGGWGPELEPLKQLAQELDIEEHVIFSGKVPYSQAPVYINCLDIAVAPFIIERNQRIGLSPLKIRDYAACGVPMVTSRIAGLEMVEEQGMGLLVEPENPYALAEALIKLLQDPELCREMGQRARAFAERELSWRAVALEILKNVDHVGLGQEP
jgi:glycosyltransferase involved in cell wall biosynthesis